MLRNHGANFNQLSSRRKSSEHYADPVDSKSKVSRGVAAIVTDLEIQMELIPFAREFACRSDRSPLRIVDFNLQFSAVALRCRGNSQQADRAKHPE
jgi:hypothetical protein